MLELNSIITKNNTEMNYYVLEKNKTRKGTPWKKEYLWRKLKN